MSDLKTKPTTQSVDGFIAAINNDARRQDCETVRQFIEDTSHQPKCLGLAWLALVVIIINMLVAEKEVRCALALHP